MYASKTSVSAGQPLCKSTNQYTCRLGVSRIPFYGTQNYVSCYIYITANLLIFQYLSKCSVVCVVQSRTHDKDDATESIMSSFRQA